jgi:hypothetical protein
MSFVVVGLVATLALALPHDASTQTWVGTRAEGLPLGEGSASRATPPEVERAWLLPVTMGTLLGAGFGLGAAASLEAGSSGGSDAGSWIGLATAFSTVGASIATCRAHQGRLPFLSLGH